MKQKSYIQDLTYDSECDILSIKFGSNKGTSGRDFDAFMTVFVGDSGDDIKSVIIFDFMSILRNSKSKIVEYESLLGIEIEKDVLPMIH